MLGAPKVGLRERVRTQGDEWGPLRREWKARNAWDMPWEEQLRSRAGRSQGTASV